MTIHASQPARIGILGGVGARASARLHRAFIERFVEVREPTSDAEFPTVLHLSAPIAGLDESGVTDERAVLEHLMTVLPVFKLAKSEVMALACNNLHRYQNWVKWATGASHVLTPVDAAVWQMQREGWKQAYVLQSSSLAATTAYPYALANAGCAYTTASPEMQDLVDEVIAGLIGGLEADCAQRLIELVAKEKPQDAVVVLGCTELSLWRRDFPWSFIDSSDALAELLLEHA